MITRVILTHLIAAYLGAGLFSGLLMQRAIPALNPLGVAYITLIWPDQIICARTNSGCDNTPPPVVAKYLFSF